MSYIAGMCCPDCGTRLVNVGGCSMCAACGWSECESCEPASGQRFLRFGRNDNE